MSILDLDAHQLIVFYHAAKEESVSLAAEKLYLTQPTVTYHLKTLEKYVGVKLFNIRKQRFCLTKAGEGLFKYSQEIWIQLNNVDKYLQTLKQSHISIGVVPVLHNVVVSCLAKIWKLHPDINFEIINAIVKDIVHKVSDSEIDIGIILATDYENSKVKPTRIAESEELIFIVSPQVQIAQRNKVEWADLLDYPLLLGSQGSLMRQYIINKLRSTGIPDLPHFVLDLVNVECSKIFVESGNGIALLHVKDIGSDVASGKYKALSLPEKLLVPVDLIVNQNTDLQQPLLEDLVSHLKQEFRNLSSP